MAPHFSCFNSKHNTPTAHSLVIVFVDCDCGVDLLDLRVAQFAGQVVDDLGDELL